MGTAVNGVIFNLDAVAEAVREKYASQYPDRVLTAREHPKPPEMLLHFAAPHFGHIEGRNLYSVWNEYSDDWNAAIEFIVFLQRYYDIEDADIPYEDFGYGANAYEVAEELGIELPEDDEEE